MARHCSKCSKAGHYASTCNKKKSSKIRRYSNRTVTRSHRGASFVGFGRGWIVLYHGGKTGKTQHDKTWSAKIVKKGSGYAVVTRHGRRAGQKNESVRGITSLERAVAKLQALMNSKLRKGYRIVGANRRNPDQKECYWCHKTIKGKAASYGKFFNAEFSQTTLFQDSLGKPRKDVWHPKCLQECKKIEKENDMRRNPWSARDVKRHNKKCASRAICRKKWSRIANAVLKKSKDEGKAIRIANWQVKRIGLLRKNPNLRSKYKRLRKGLKPRICAFCKKKNGVWSISRDKRGRSRLACTKCLNNK